MADPGELLRIASLLERLICSRNVSIRRLESVLRLSHGSLYRILNGRTELRFRHILDILEAIDVSPKDFFKLAYGSGDLLQDREMTLASSPSSPILRDDLEQVISDILARHGLC